LTQFDIKCRIFYALVEPVMSYGCQIWGAYMLATSQARQRPWDNAADKVQAAFLREMAGVGRGVSTAVLLRDFHRRPLAHQWLKLACRWWASLAAMEPTRMAHVAWLSDIDLMLQGCQDCWTYNLLSALTWLELLPARAWNPAEGGDVSPDAVKLLCFEEKNVVAALHSKLFGTWHTLHPDPRAAGEVDHEKCIHAAWIMPMPAADHAAAPTPAHMKLCMPFAVLQTLARFRLGQHDLESRMARHRRHRGEARVPWGERWCKLCSVAGAPCERDRQAAGMGLCAEDLRHFLLECPAYSAIRCQCFPDVFAVGCDVADANAKVAAIFSEAGSLRHQQQLASCLMMMNRRRVHCLGLQTAAAGAAATGRQPAGRRARNPALDALNAIDAELDRLGIFACPIAADE
jgi:hypothetical protein